MAKLSEREKVKDEKFKLAIQKLKEENSRLQLKNKQLEIDNGLANKLVNEYKVKLEDIGFDDKEYVINRILSLRAKNYTMDIIKDKLDYLTSDGVDYDYIKTICNNIEDLDNKYVLYYSDQVKLFQESLKNNPVIMSDFVKKTTLKMIDYAVEDMNKLSDSAEKSKIRLEIEKHLNTIVKLNKNLIEESNGMSLDDGMVEAKNNLLENISVHKISFDDVEEV